jgi:formylglycine-generating enzyme
MKAHLAIVVTLVWAASVSAVTLDMVTVGNIGNANDPSDGDNFTSGSQHFGGVSYAYSIGKYEVTVGQYTAFLNAVAATDTYDLYNPSMTTDLNSAEIARSGASGGYSYSVIGSPNHPVTFVSWGDAARFSNWLNNGQLAGAQDSTTTEDGAYTLKGATSIASLNAVSRNAGALWFIPTENEWYKAAYYQPAAQGGDSTNYWALPQRSNTVPYSDQPPGATPDNTKVANYDKDDNIANGYNDGYAVTGSPNYNPNQNYLTDVGAYTLSASFYSTYDQGGNVWEWNEAVIGSDRGFRGGSWSGDANDQTVGVRNGNNPTHETHAIGFRVATYVGPPGDYNHNGTVDAGDYVVWRHNNGSAVVYNLWRAGFGVTLTGSGTSSESAAVPEPSSFALFIFVNISALAGCRRKSVPHNRV